MQEQHMTTDYSSVKFDTNSMKITINSIQNKLGILKDYQGDQSNPPPKLYVINSQLKIDERYGQGIRRWFNGDSRHELYKYLNYELNDLCLLLNMINIAINHDRFDVKLQSIRDNLLTLVNSITKGVECLLYLYPDYEMFNSMIKLCLNKMSKFVILHDTQPLQSFIQPSPFVNPLV